MITNFKSPELITIMHPHVLFFTVSYMILALSIVLGHLNATVSSLVTSSLILLTKIDWLSDNRLTLIYIFSPFRSVFKSSISATSGSCMRKTTTYNRNLYSSPPSSWIIIVAIQGPFTLFFPILWCWGLW